MIFQLGKKSSDDETVREETFKRWREASQRSSEGGESVTSAVEESKGDDIPAVQWPDPRATISLTREVDRGGDLSEQKPVTAAPVPTSAPVPESFIQKTTTSKLAQFVSSGLNATGLLGAAPKPAPVKVTESVRLVEPIREVERKPAPAQEIPPAPEDDIKRRFGTNIRSALGPGTIIEGTFSFDSPVCIEGTLIGEVRSNSVLIVGSQATVSAKVRVGSLIVLGTVKGDVESDELVEIKTGGSLEGDVISERIAIEDGGWFQGRCTPTTRGSKQPMRPTLERAPVQAETVLVGDEPFAGRTVSAERWTIE